MNRATVAFPLLVAAFSPLAASRVQVPAGAVRVTAGFGVDTLGVPSHDIFALWRSYLASGPACTQENTFWSPVERRQWPIVYLLCGYVYQGFSSFTGLHLAPAVG